MKNKLKNTILLGAFCIGFGLLFTSCEKDIPPVIKQPLDSLILDSLKADSLLKIGLVAHYPFYKNFKDYSDSFTVGINNGSAFITGRLGLDSTAIHFKGNNSFVEIPTNKLLNNEYSYAMWLRIAGTPGPSAYYLSIGGDGADQAMAISDATNPFNNIGWYTGGYSQGTPNSAGCYLSVGEMPTYNKWYFVVATRSSETLSLYVDGKLIKKTTTDNKLPNYSNSNIHGIIGGRFNLDDAMWYEGDVDDVKIWNRAITKEEVLLLSKLKTEL